VSLLALTGGTVYTDALRSPIAGGVVLIDGTRVSAVGKAGEVAVPDACATFDCSGGTVTAGFWNSHVHLTQRKWARAAGLPASQLSVALREFTRYGFTTLFDLSSLYENTEAIRQRADSGEVDGPRIFSTGEGIVPRGAAPPPSASRKLGWMHVSLPEAETAEEAADAAQALLRKGVDAIKMFASGPLGSSLSTDALRAVVRCAHAANKPTFVHPNSIDDVRRSLEATVDVLAHTVPKARFEKDDVERIAGLGIALIPTLALWKYRFRGERAPDQKLVAESAVEQLAAVRAAGGSILFGTDYGAVGPDPTDEYRLMTEAGMGFTEILAALTTVPASRFGDSAVTGRVAAGDRADIVVLSGNASRGVDILTGVRLTIRSGRVVYAASG
jgi:imidazolonepropionase-like amidohydrolase